MVWIAYAVMLCPLAAVADDSPAPAQSAGGEATYLLRYKFQPGETLRWNVVHRVKVNTTVSGTTQTAETTSTSVKVWKALPAKKEGTHSFEHSVERVEMRQKLTGREEIVYNSQTDAAPPLGFEDAAKNVGVPLAVITIDGQGAVIDRERKRSTPSDGDSQIVIPLPAEAVPVGHVWSFPYDVQVSLRSGESRQIKTRQRFTLESVDGGIASIRVETQVLTPVNDPEIEAQLIQRETRGTVRFDIAAGRIVEQRMDLDKSVLGFSGESSSLHYVMRFTEELLPATATASAPVAKPAGPVGPAAKASPPKAPAQAQAAPSNPPAQAKTAAQPSGAQAAKANPPAPQNPPAAQRSATGSKPSGNYRRR
jgi:hypothetical protein